MCDPPRPPDTVAFTDTSYMLTPRCRPSLEKPAADIDHVAMAVMAVGVSSAMAFLERNRVIHRDVAARNVLVGATYADVKLGDLGAARNVKSKEEYTYIATTEHMPARWLPLEAIRDAAFSHKSDVFSFGVLMWEICTLGKPPWGAFGVADIVEGLRNGERLQRPGDAPDQMHDLCTRCWVPHPADRPPFAQVNDELQILPAILRNTPAGGAYRNRASTTTRHTGYESEATFDEAGNGGGVAGVAAGALKQGAGHGDYMEESVMNPAFGHTAPEAQGGVEVEIEVGAGGVWPSADAEDADGAAAVGARPRTASVLPEASGYVHTLAPFTVQWGIFTDLLC